MIVSYNLANGTASVDSQEVFRSGANLALKLVGLNGSKDLSDFTFTIYARSKSKVFYEKTIPPAGTKLSKTDISWLWSERVTWDDQGEEVYCALRVNDGETVADVNFGPATSRVRTKFAPVEADARVVAATEASLGDVQMPSYWPCIVDVRGMSEFDGVTSGGNRLNYLCYSSTDHDGGDGGIYLALCFGDPVTGIWKRYDTALADGDLASFSGNKPSATGGLIFQYSQQCETPWVNKVGSTWVMTFHPSIVSGASGQRTLKATSSSPFGAFTVTDHSPPTEAFLNVDEASSTEHTGYAIWIPTPANSSVTDDYFMCSLFQGGETPTFAYWGADSTMENPTQIGSAVAPADYSLTIPLYELDAGDPLVFEQNNLLYLEWDGTDFVALTRGSKLASGVVVRTGILYQIDVAADLTTRTNPQIVLAPGDLWDLRGANDARVALTDLQVPQIIGRPAGGHALVVGGQGDLSGGEEYVIVMPITVN